MTKGKKQGSCRNAIEERNLKIGRKEERKEGRKARRKEGDLGCKRAKVAEGGTCLGGRGRGRGGGGEVSPVVIALRRGGGGGEEIVPSK